MKNWAKERVYNKKDVAQKRRQVHRYYPYEVIIRSHR